MPETQTKSRVADMMSRQPICVGPRLEITEFRQLLIENHISGVPVVDEEGCPIGVVSRTDLITWEDEVSRSEDPPPRTVTVADIMSPIAMTVGEGDDIRTAASIMARHGMHRVPVVNRRNKVTGVLTTMDVCRWVAKRA